MDKNKIIKKITSRKFIVTAVIIVAGLAAAFKESGNEKVQIAGCVMAGVASIVYMVIEGTVDKASVQTETKNILDAVEGIEINAEKLKTED